MLSLPPPVPCGVPGAAALPLEKWLNPAYLTSDAINQISKQFRDTGSVQLQRFLRPELASAILAEASRADATDAKHSWVAEPGQAAYSVGMDREGWNIFGPAHMQRYLQFHPTDCKSADGIGMKLSAVEQELLKSEAFGNWISAIAGTAITGHSSEIRRFRPGLDYTVAHHGLLESEASRLDATLCFVSNGPKSTVMATSPWDAGDVGGFEVRPPPSPP